MAKRTSLSAALSDAGGKVTPATLSISTPKPDEATTPQPKQALPPSRVGKKAIAAYFDPAVHTQLKILAAERGTSIQQVMGEAINDLFTKHHKSPIA